MAAPESKRISELDLAAPLTDADLLVVVQQGKTKRTTYSQVRTGAQDGCQCTLASRFTTVGTDANTIKKYLYTYTLPADTIVTDGSWLEIHAAGFFAANGNTKRASLEIKQNSTGLSAIVGIPPDAYNDDYWYMDFRIQKSGDTTYVLHSNVSVVANTTTPLQTPSVLHSVGDGTGSDWTAGDLQFCITAQNGTANANDITCNTFIIVGHLLDVNS